MNPTTAPVRPPWCRPLHAYVRAMRAREPRQRQRCHRRPLPQATAGRATVGRPPAARVVRLTAVETASPIAYLGVLGPMKRFRQSCKVVRAHKGRRAARYGATMFIRIRNCLTGGWGSLNWRRRARQRDRGRSRVCQLVAPSRTRRCSARVDGGASNRLVSCSHPILYPEWHQGLCSRETPLPLCGTVRHPASASTLTLARGCTEPT